MSRRLALLVGLLAMATPAIAKQELRPTQNPNPFDESTQAVPIDRLVSMEDLTPPFVSELFDGEDTPDTIYAGSATFTTADEPVIPDLLRRPVFTEDGKFVPGWFVVHFERDLLPADKTWLDEVTAPITRVDGSPLSRWYIPNNAMIVKVADEDTYELLAVADPIDFIGPYHPAYKIDPRIGTVTLTSPERVGRSLLQLDIDLIPGADPEQIQSALIRAGVTVLNHVHDRGLFTFDVNFVVVSCSPSLLVRVAQIEGVRTIQESGDGVRLHGLSGGGKLQNRQLAVDDGTHSPVVTASTFPLWLTHNLQGQRQLIGVVDTSMDWNNTGTAGCGFGYPDVAIDNYGFALPNLSSLLLGSVGTGGVNLKIPRADMLGGATLLGIDANEHGVGVSGAALGDFYGNNSNKWWEHDPDTWDSWAPTNYSGLLGPGIAHEAQLFFTPVMDSNNGFRWESAGEFPANMGITLTNMANAGVCTTNHSVGLNESNNTYTQTTVVHDTKGYDHPNMLQCMAAGNAGAGANKLTSQSVAKNVLCVGASDDVLKPEDRVTFSSTGPSFDNRIKPDIMAPGSDTAARAGGVSSLLILPNTNGSSSASCAYQYTSGTSFASPIMAGAGALIHQYFEEGRYTGSQSILDPSAALLKAALVNAGHRLTGANLGNTSYPNMYQGWGEPDLSAVLDFGTGSRRLIAHDVPRAAGFFSSGSANDSYTVTVNNAGQGLKVSLAWTDEPGSTGVGKKLINDLDLLVTSPTGTVYRGNVFSASAGVSTTGGSADTLNNLENVILTSPATGSWTITVDPGAGNYASGQGYALVITGDVAEGGGTPAPVANFSGTPTSGNYPLAVNFTNLTSGSATSYAWTFGDGGTSTATNPSHTYTSAGSYTVGLTATGPGGSNLNTKTNYIVVSTPPVPPSANFSGTPTSGNSPLAVNFTNLTTGSVTSYSWTFGDGGTSTATNPGHTYTSSGSYTVSLTATGPGGTNVATKVGYITVGSPPAAPVANFSGTPTSGTAPLVVNFTDLSTGSITSYAWTFGDGATSTSANPSHTYTSAGSYAVSLTVTGPGGSDPETKAGYITVSNPSGGAGLWYLSFDTTTTVPGLGSVADEDVVTYNPATGAWAMYFDGSDVGLGGTDINALHILDDGSLVFSIDSASFSIPGLIGGPSGTTMEDSDLVLFAFTSSGANTSGSMQFVFDGSDVGLTTSNEDIDGVYEFPGGGLAISTLGNPGVTGLSGLADEDVLIFNATQYGATTTGTWSLQFDGSDVGFGASSNYDLNAISFDNGVDLLFSTIATYSAAGGSGDDEDISRFVGTYGATTSGTAQLILNLSALGISTAEDVDGMCFK